MAGRRTLRERLQYRSLQETADALGLSARQVKRRINQGIFREPRRSADDGRYLFTEQDIKRYRELLDAHPELIDMSAPRPRYQA